MRVSILSIKHDETVIGARSVVFHGKVKEIKLNDLQHKKNNDVIPQLFH